MKKKLSLLLAVLFVAALFTGCAGNGGNPSGGDVPAPGPETDTGKDDTASDNNLAAGKWEFNEDGLSSAKYVYQLPLTTEDNTFTRWTTCYTPEYIPEDGWASIETWAGVEDMTGVHVEYDVVSSEGRSENFATLLVSDDLRDFTDQAWFFYTDGTVKDAIYEEEFFANLYPYKEYMPNYLYEIWSRSLIGGEFDDKADAYQTAFYEDDLMAGMYGMLVDPAPGQGYWLRQDWMDELGLGDAKDVTTYDELHDVLLAIKNAGLCEYPFAIFSNIEVAGGVAFAGYNTAAYAGDLMYNRVVDGEVQFCGTTEDDRDVMTLLNSWWNEGLIHPNYASFSDTQAMSSVLANGEVAAVVFTPSEVGQWQAVNIDPDCRYEAIPRTKKYDGQILQYGQKQSNFHFGSVAISAKCENMPLAVSYWDWWFSDEGSEWTSWGPQGILWDYNEKGERQLTDFCLNHPAGMAWIMCIYGNNGLVECCLQIHERNYAYPGGEVYLEAFDLWTEDDYGGEYDWPQSVEFTDDENSELASIRTDLSTYFQEHYIQFLDGTRPLSQWDDFIEELNNVGSFGGLKTFVGIYQDAYDRYMAE